MTEEAPEEEQAILRRAARYAWALPLARIYGVFSRLCSDYGGEMRIIAFILAPRRTGVCTPTSAVK